MRATQPFTTFVFKTLQKVFEKLQLKQFTKKKVAVFRTSLNCQSLESIQIHNRDKQRLRIVKPKLDKSQ